MILSKIKKKLHYKISRDRLDQFMKKHKTNKRTLDIGCAGGPYSDLFPNRVGLDVYEGPAVDYVGDVHNLNMFKDKEFNCIIMTEVLEHLHSPQIAVKELNRILKKNGKLILTTRFIFPIHDYPKDYFRFTESGLRELLKDFKIVEIKPEANTIETIAILFQRIGLQTETLNSKFLSTFWLLLARFTLLFSKIITKEYGEPHKKNKIQNIINSGFYVVCKKK